MAPSNVVNGAVVLGTGMILEYLQLLYQLSPLGLQKHVSSCPGSSIPTRGTILIAHK